jgi:hypothetical protein
MAGDLTRQESERAMREAYLASSVDFPRLGTSRASARQTTEEQRQYSRSRQPRGTRPEPRMEVEDRPMAETAEVTPRGTTYSEKAINKKLIKKINTQMLGIFKQILYFKSLLKPDDRFYFFEFRYKIKNTLKHFSKMIELSEIHNKRYYKKNNIFFSDSFYNWISRNLQSQNYAFVDINSELTNLEDYDLIRDDDIHKNIMEKGIIYNLIIKLIDALKIELITKLITIYIQIMEAYKELRLKERIKITVEQMKRLFLTFVSNQKIENDYIINKSTFYIKQFRIGYDSFILAGNLQLTPDQVTAKNLAIADQEKQREDRIRQLQEPDLESISFKTRRYRELKQREERNKRQSDERTSRLEFERVTGDLERGFKAQINEGRAVEPGSINKQLRYLINKSFETQDGEFKIKVPREFIDPFTFTLMRNPVILSDGKSYDASTVSLISHPYHDTNGLPFELSQHAQTYRDYTRSINLALGPGRPKFFENQLLRQRINEFLEQVYPGLSEEQLNDYDFNY